MSNKSQCWSHQKPVSIKPLYWKTAQVEAWSSLFPERYQGIEISKGNRDSLLSHGMQESQNYCANAQSWVFKVAWTVKRSGKDEELFGKSYRVRNKFCIVSAVTAKCYYSMSCSSTWGLRFLTNIIQGRKDGVYSVAGNSGSSTRSS